MGLLGEVGRGGGGQRGGAVWESQQHLGPFHLKRKPVGCRLHFGQKKLTFVPRSPWHTFQLQQIYEELIESAMLLKQRATWERNFRVPAVHYVALIF